MEVQTADGRGLLEYLLLLVLSLAIQNQQLIASIKLNIVGQAARGTIGLVWSTNADSGTAGVYLAHFLVV